MTRWIIEKSQRFTNVGLLRISESVRAYTYLILSSQASARSGIVGNTVSALTAQKAFLNNFEDIINRGADIREDIKRYQDTLSYTSSKVDYSMGEHIYTLRSDMNLNIRSGTVDYNNKILVSDGKFSLGKNDKVNALVLEPVISMLSHEVAKIKSHKYSAQPTHANELSQKPTITHNEEKLLWYFFWQVVLQYGIHFIKSQSFLQ